MKTVTIVYVGKRMTTKNRLSHFWQWPDEQELKGYKTQVVPASIGEAWDVTTDGAKILLTGEQAPKRNEAADASIERIRTWTAEQVLAYSDMDRIRFERTVAKRKDEFEKALEPMRALVKSLRTHGERSKFVSYLQSELFRP